MYDEYVSDNSGIIMEHQPATNTEERGEETGSARLLFGVNVICYHSKVPLLYIPA
jgi:hypothetical protein